MSRNDTVTVEDLYQWLMANHNHVLAANLNQAAGLYADALADARRNEDMDEQEAEQLDFEGIPGIGDG